MSLGLFGAGVVVASAVVAQANRSFVVDGTVVGTDVLQEKGRYWVPLDDVGRYFGYFVSVNPSQANLTKIPTAPTPNQGGQTGPNQSAAPSGPSGGIPATSPPASPTGSAQQFVSGTGSQVNTGPSGQAQSGADITVGLNQNASVGGFDYGVTEIRDAGPQYREAFDQRASLLHAKYKSDALVVVVIHETNRGDKPVQAIIPDASTISVFDSKKVGYAATNIDVRIAAAVIDKSSSLALDIPDDQTNNITLGPGGTLEFAAIASVPAGDTIQGVILNITGSDVNGNAGGAVITVNR